MVVVGIWGKKKIVLKATKMSWRVSATVGNSTLTVVDFQKKVQLYMHPGVVCVCSSA